jgi:ATP-dependent exoDNAse (exonuclease V) beta subunit
MAITAAARWREDRERGEPPAGEGARDGQPGEGAALEGTAVDGEALEGAVLDGAAVDGETQEHEEVWEPGRERTRKHEQSRHGPIFGEVVHRALELEIGGSCDTLEEATGRAVREHQLAPELHDEARRDIARTHAALAEQGLLAGTCLVEHPVVLEADGRLLAGIIDLLVVGEDEVVVIDYKTDRKRPGSARAAYPEYAAQLELYGEALARSGLLGERRLRLGLLLTERGQISWLEPPPG